MNSTFLDKIVSAKRTRVAALKNNIQELIRSARSVRDQADPHRFQTVLSDLDQSGVIAEFKRASPSKGRIDAAADPAQRAKQYQAGGASAMSILTEEDFFLGSLDDLKAARQAIDIPILRKDFVLDPVQVYESAAAGADAVLLIAAILDDDMISTLFRLANDELGMDAIVEVHNRQELERAERINARLIGINNRDLNTFEVSLDVSRDLARRSNGSALLIAESGLSSADEINELRALGFSGFLIGESLMRSGDPAEALKKLVRSRSDSGDRVPAKFSE
ncbi:MAG: indole-3-glycerol phosphate synthase TrpC [Acidobacteriota bacterium]